LGFGDGPSWLPQPPVFATLAAAAQEHDPASTLALYRSALELRRTHLVDEVGFELLDAGADVLAFRRGDGFVCVTNMGGEPVGLPDGEVLLSSGPLAGAQLPPDTTVWIV
jgi:alpha-glucosidase